MVESADDRADSAEADGAEADDRRRAAKRRAWAGTSLFLALAPGTVAGVVPWLLTRWQPGDPPYPLPVRVLGAAAVVASGALILAAFARFVREGVGTPAPAAPTERLVVGGLYRFVRNPMYLAVSGAILGQALLLGRPVLLAYGLLITAANASFVRWYEEPTLRRQFGADYDTYRAAVPAWRPRLHPWTPDPPKP